MKRSGARRRLRRWCGPDSHPSPRFYALRLPLEKRRWEPGGEGRQRARAGTSFRLKVGDAVHDHMVQKQGLVVHFDGAREQATEVVHVPGGREREAASAWSLVLEQGHPRLSSGPAQPTHPPLS